MGYDSRKETGMCKINCEIVEGLMPLEKVARIRTADGEVEEVAVPSQQVTDNRQLHASELGRDGDKVLIELPREAASGKWRLWIDANTIGG